jgi:hypothetical protein
VSCLGLVFVVMGLVLLVVAWTSGRSLVLALGSLAYVAVGSWVLANYLRQRRPP